MSNLWNWAAKDVFGLGKGRRDHISPDQRRLGTNRDPYYGTAAKSILEQKGGQQKYADSVLGPAGGPKKTLGAASKLLGGG